jgi:hypothetical protein
MLILVGKLNDCLEFIGRWLIIGFWLQEQKSDGAVVYRRELA